MGALEALIAPEVVEEVVIEVEKEVATACGAAPKAMGTNNRGFRAKAEVPVGFSEVVKTKDADES